MRAPPATPPCTLNPGDIWCSLLPVTSSAAGLFGASIGDLSDFDFTYKEKTYRFRLIRQHLPSGHPDGRGDVIHINLKKEEKENAKINSRAL